MDYNKVEVTDQINIFLCFIDYSHKKKLENYGRNFVLKKILIEEYSISNFCIKVSKRGKPYLQDSDYFFSISYTNKIIAIMVSYGKECGLDIEKIEKVDISNAKYFMSSIEQNKKLTIDYYFRMWTRKEAILKCYGSGLIVDPTRVTVINDRVRVFGYNFSVCTLKYTGYIVSYSILCN